MGMSIPLLPHAVSRRALHRHETVLNVESVAQQRLRVEDAAEPYVGRSEKTQQLAASWFR
jgi:hypothetical protein